MISTNSELRAARVVAEQRDEQWERELESQNMRLESATTAVSMAEGT